MAHNEISDIVTLFTEDDLARLGVKPRSLRLAKARGVFPASWYFVVREICARSQIQCSDQLFTFKDVDGRKRAQGGKATADSP